MGAKRRRADGNHRMPGGARNPWRNKPGPRPTHPLESRAIVYLLKYTGDFPFLLDLKRRISRPNWRLTPKQVDAVLRCAARDARLNG